MRLHTGLPNTLNSLPILPSTVRLSTTKATYIPFRSLLMFRLRMTEGSLLHMAMRLHLSSLVQVFTITELSALLRTQKQEA
nr:MAG TPA: hypothetical protein [Bacteriophage sp.]